VTRRRALAVLVVWVGCVAVMAGLEMRPAVLALGAIVAAVAGVIAVVFDLADLPVPVDWSAVRDSGTSNRGADPRVRTLRRQLLDERRLDLGHLHRTMVELVDDRLLAHHHIVRAADPAAAAAVLAPSLREVLASSPDDRLLSDPRRLQRILTDLEAL
jgi:hypothetical protein